MKFREIFCFEFAYQVRRLSTWLYFTALVVVGYGKGRVGYGWDVLGERTSDEDYVTLRKSMKKRPVDYFHSFIADTALFGAASATR